MPDAASQDVATVVSVSWLLFFSTTVNIIPSLVKTQIIILEENSKEEVYDTETGTQ